MKNYISNKRLLFIIINFILINTIYCQITRVVYKTNIYGNDLNSDNIKDKVANVSNEEAKMLESFFRSQNGVELELIYDKKKSLFRKVEILEKDGSIANKLPSIFDKEIYFKNNETKEKLYQTEYENMTYNILLPFDNYKWVITDEMKIINGYKCYKATTTFEDIYNPRKGTKNTFSPFVWFAPDIPCSFGPKGLDGLPGLVLEGSINGKKYFYATLINFDFKKESKIEKPKNGRDITIIEFENILKDNFKKS